MWTLAGDQDRMRLQESGLSPEAQRTMLEVLTGNPSPDDLSQGGCLLYLCPNKVEFVGQMPSFDEWGLRPVSLVGPHENPVVVAPLLAASTDLAPRVDIGRQASLEAVAWVLRCRRRLRFQRRQPQEPVRLVLRQSLWGRCSRRLPRPEPLRPRQASMRWSLIALPSFALLRLTAWVSL